MDPLHFLSLDSIHDSMITNINLYTNRAQVTRSYKFNVPAGQTKLAISSLPNVVDHNSLRVEGRGPAIIQGVTAFTDNVQQPDKTSPLLEELNAKKERVQVALERCKKAVIVIDHYMDKISIEQLDISKLGEAMDVYDTTEEKWDSKILDLEKEIEVIDKQIHEETTRMRAKVGNKKLRTTVVMGLFAVDAAELRINLIYAVSRARWEAGYDIRVNMQDKDVPVKVVYKAAISQQTGEIWENAPITLETAEPTFGLELPSLAPWHISHTQPAVDEFECDDFMEDDTDYITTNAPLVTSKGNVNATFQIPGLTTIPSDDEEHGVTIADLELPAMMTWACIPKGDTRVHLEASITNTSEFTFLPGPSNVYVDQSFISRSKVPSVSPREVFRCPLGVDPTIRVTYRPQAKMVSESGFYNKSLKHSYSGGIMIHNTKSMKIDGLKITDHIPVSQDAHITVSLITPALTVPGPSTGSLQSKALVAPPQLVPVSEGVVAQWHGADQWECDVSALGRNGQFDWVCAVPAHGKVNLQLEYEVATSEKTNIFGL